MAPPPASSDPLAAPSPSPSATTSSSIRTPATPPPPPTFVDYSVQAPDAAVLPPAKYKLWLVVWVLVYLARWVSDAAQLLRAFQFGGWSSPNAAQFLMLYLIVFVLVYAGLDFAVTVGTFRCGSSRQQQQSDDDESESESGTAAREYGLGPWLKAPRAAWMYRNDDRYNYKTSLAVQILATVVWKLERGFCMFDAASPADNTKTTQTAVAVRIRRKKPSSATSSSSTAATSFRSDDDDDDSENDDDDDDDDMLEYFPPRCESATACPTVVLKIEHRIDPGKLSDYDRWLSRIRQSCRQQRGLLKVESAGLTAEEEEEEDDDDDDGAHEQARRSPRDHHSDDDDDDDGIDVEQQQQQQQHNDGSSSSRSSSRNMLHVVYCTFENIDCLNEWLLSPRRQVLMTELRPMLVQPDSVQIQRDRILPDAFTDLVAAQGRCVPKRPPKKWKVWWLTTVALHITICWTDSFLDHYYEQWGWGLDDAHPRVRALVGVTVSTFLNSYVLTPLLLFLFHPWMQRESSAKDDEDEVERQEPWRTLNDGFRDDRTWIKALITFAFYGGCVIVWIVRDYAL